MPTHRKMRDEWGTCLNRVAVQALASSTGLRGTIRATRAMIFLFCVDFFRS